MTGNAAKIVSTPVIALPGWPEFQANILNRPIERINTGWEDTLVPLGLALLGAAFADDALIDWVEHWVDYHLAQPLKKPPLEDVVFQKSGDPNQGIFLTPYCGDWGAAMVFAALYNLRPTQRLIETTRLIADHICDASIRVENGAIAHSNWSKMPWVDTLYYTASPLARAYQITQEPRYAREALNQCIQHAYYLRDPQTGCWFHEADTKTGERTTSFWSRGNGWVIMALADTLRYCPPETEGWNEVLAYYRALVTGLLRFQHPCGLWRIIPENGESHLETSGSIMIATGITVGIVEGWLNGSTVASVWRTWHEVLTWIDAQGWLMGCQTPAGRGGWEVHKRSQMGERTYGTGSLLRLAAELRKGDLL